MTNRMKICSPMAYGNGAYVVHKMLEANIKNYKVRQYNPYWTLIPFVLPFLGCNKTTDIIHTTPDYGLFFRKRNSPLVLTLHNFMLDSFMQSYSSLAQRIHYRTDLRWFTKQSLELADMVTCVSNFTADLVRKESGYKKHIKVIYNGIDTNKFKPATYKKDGPIKILFSGNLTQRKGAHLLPGIADKLNPGILIQYTRGLRTKGRQFDSTKLHDIGSVKYSDMPEVYRQADILLFPTVREGLSLAALEAMASGLPVIATNCSSMPELVVDGKGGYLCELGNENDFARRINELADSPQLRKEMGQFNRERAEQEFTLNKMTENYRLLFEEVLSSRK